MIDATPQKYIKQGDNYYFKVQKKLPTYPNDLQFMHTQLNKAINFSSFSTCVSHCSRALREFQRAFKTLNKLQQTRLYCDYAHITYNCLFNVPESAFQIPQKLLKFQVYIVSNTTWKWQLKQIYIDFQEKKLTLVQEEISINLRNFIIRHSRNKNRQAIALESVSHNEYIQTLRMSNYEGSFEEFQQTFTNIMKYFLRQRICKVLGKSLIINEQKDEELLFDQRLPKFQDEIILKNIDNIQSQSKLHITAAFNQQVNEPNIKVVQPSHDNVKSFENIRHYLEDSQHLKGYTTIRQNVYFDYKNQIMRKAYVFEIMSDQQIYLRWICDNFNNHRYFYDYKRSLTDVDLMKTQQNSKVFHQTYEIGEKTIDFTYKRTRYISNNIIYYFDQQESISGPHIYRIDFNIIKIQKSLNYINVTEQCRVQFLNSNEKDGSLQLCDNFLGDISLVVKGFSLKDDQNSIKIMSSYLFQQENLSKIKSRETHSCQQDDFFSIQQDIDGDQNRETSPQHQISREYINMQRKVRSNTYLTIHHPIEPLQKTSPKLRYAKTPGKHPFWEGQYEVNQLGQVVCINKEKLKAQDGILKQLFKLVANHLMKGKSIFRISLPAKIMAPDSMLSHYCNSYAYAPLFLEKAVRTKDSIERIKNVAMFHISCIVAELRNEIPVNPILGETHQTMIDGCPVYAEQISHNPPISAFFMKGRGYTFYNHFQLKISFGMNSIGGTKNGVFHVDFDDGLSEIRYKQVTGEMYGVIYGDRFAKIADSSYFIDTQSRIFLRLRVGKQKGATQFSKMINGIQGQIVKVSEKADLQHFWNIGEEEIIERYGFIKGLWTDDIFYQDQCLFNAFRDLSFVCTPYPYSLQSDSLKRLDVKERIAHNLEKTNFLKEELENIQRNDRKLREKYKK